MVTNHDTSSGCHTPAFLYETLKTMQLLFPAHDRPWLEKRIKKQSLDKRLKAPFIFLHKEDWHSRPLTNRRELYARYPHWAVRLHTIYEEAQDPTPMSWVGRWSERQKAARHTFWLTYLAIVVAVLFGIVSVVLGVFQVWISWCSWGGNETRACRIGKIASDKAGSQSTVVEISNETTGTVAARSVFTWVA